MKKGLFLILAIFCHNLFASELKVQTLLKACEDQKEVGPSSFCLGYVISAREKSFEYIFGYMDGVSYERGLQGDDPGDKTVATAIDTSSDLYGCLGGKTNSQLISAFIKWADENPQEWHNPAMTGFKVSMATAFPPPCEK